VAGRGDAIRGFDARAGKKAGRRVGLSYPENVRQGLDDAWERAFHLTLMSAVRLARAALPSMKARGWGRILNITSMSAKQPVDGLLLSNAMRAAVAVVSSQSPLCLQSSTR